MKSNFGMDRFFRTGSIGNETNVNGYSDTDYFAGIPRENLKKNSSLTLKAIKEALQVRFPSTNIFVSSPAVVIEFGTAQSETTEIIPADFLKTENGVNIYDIPKKIDKLTFGYPSVIVGGLLVLGTLLILVNLPKSSPTQTRRRTQPRQPS